MATRRFEAARVPHMALLLSGLLLLPATAHTQTISGRVTSATDRLPVPSALVLLEGTRHHTSTDPGGSFSLPGVAPGTYEILVVHVGLHSTRLPVHVSGEAADDLEIALTPRAIPLGTIRARARSAVDQWRRAVATAHHVFITRDELDTYELRGARHVGDALRRHAPNAVRVIENNSLTLGSSQSPQGPRVCVMSTRAQQRASVLNPATCAPVMIDGLLISVGSAYLYDLPLSEVENVEFLPPMDAITRFGHAGEDGVVAITTRRGSELVSSLPFGAAASGDGSGGHASYVAVGASVGFFGAFGATYGPGLFDRQAEFCTTDCGQQTLRFMGAILVGAGLGELLYRLIGKPDR